MPVPYYWLYYCTTVPYYWLYYWLPAWPRPANSPPHTHT